MNSLQIEYLNALNNSKRIESEIALNKAKSNELAGRLDYTNAQTHGQRLSNREFESKLSNLARKVLNDKYRLDMDNAMLYNTVDWWVNGGKKLSDHSNRMYNPYWNTRGNLVGDWQGIVGSIQSTLGIPSSVLGMMRSPSSGDTSANVRININNSSKGFINS